MSDQIELTSPSNVNTESRPNTALETLAKLNQLLKLNQKDNLVDLVNLPNDEVFNYFEQLTDSSHFVLHGTNSLEPYPKLTPQTANDAAKESGNKRAIYATVIPDVALMMAILNRKYLRTIFNSYTFGEDFVDDKRVYKASPNLYDLFVRHDPNLTSDGFVYILDKSQFNSAPETQTEYHREGEVLPIEICKVSRQIGETLFIIGKGQEDTVFPYSNDEMARIEAFNQTRRK